MSGAGHDGPSNHLFFLLGGNIVSKTVKILIALVVALAVATPAMAAFKLNGYYRLQGTSYSFNRAAGSQTDSSTFFDNRLRLKSTYTLNDYISVVYYAEIDTPWGETSKGGVGGGGQRGADGVNIETKNAYVDFKVPDTSWTVRTGVQGGGIGAPYESLVEDDDMAGVKAMGKIGGVNTTFLYSKWYENDRNQWDDTDYYAADANMMVTEQFKLGGSLIFLDVNGVPNSAADADIEDIYAGLYANYKMDNMDIGGFFLYRNFSDDLSGATIDKGDAYVVDLSGKMELDNGYVKLHTAYFSNDDKSDEMNTFSPAAGGFEYHKDNLSLFLTDVFYNNAPHTAFALSDAAYAGYGLIFLTVSGKVDLPQDYYVRYGAGYFSALKDSANDAPSSADKDGKTLGGEVAARIGKVFAEKYDLSLRGAYGFLGNFYNSTNPALDDPDDIYQVVGMVNVSF
jgi:hypothetical protein